MSEMSDTQEMRGTDNQDDVRTVTMKQVEADAGNRTDGAFEDGSAAEHSDTTETEVLPATEHEDAPTREMPVSSAVEAESGARRTDIPLNELADHMPENTVPMYSATPQTNAGASAAGTSPAYVPPVSAARATPAPQVVIRDPAPTGVSGGTIALGVLLILLGVIAVASAGLVSDWPFGDVDPWVVAAVGVGVVGVVLVVIAIVWAVVNTVANHRREHSDGDHDDDSIERAAA